MKKVMKNKKVIAMMVVGLVAIFLATSGVVASPPMFGDASPVASTINYQGQLTDPDTGIPYDGTYDMEFLFYDAATGGSQVGSTITENDVELTNGLFSVKLEVDQSDFNGRGLWIEVKVEGEVLNPRQEILPVPYALSLKPGAVISDTNSYVGLNRYITKGVPRYSCGVYAESEGEGLFVDRYYGVYGRGSSAGIYGSSDSGAGVHGYSASGAAISASGTGVIESTANSYIFISGNGFINQPYSSNQLYFNINGSVIIRSGGAYSGYIYMPITVPGVLYGQEVTVEELTIYYKCEDGSKNYITRTSLTKQTDADSEAVIVDDNSDRMSNTATSYSFSLTQNNVLSSSQGILCLILLLQFVDDTNYIQIGGVRLRLSHS